MLHDHIIRVTLEAVDFQPLLDSLQTTCDEFSLNQLSSCFKTPVMKVSPVGGFIDSYHDVMDTVYYLQWLSSSCLFSVNCCTFLGLNQQITKIKVKEMKEFSAV